MLVDWLAFAVSLVAIFVTFRELRRNNAVCLVVEDCRAFSQQAIGKNNGQLFDQFTVRVRNKGMSVYGLTAAICFNGPDGSGRITCPMRRQRLAGDADELCKGMIAEFYFKSFELSDLERAFLLSLKSPRAQNARLNFYSQSYLCASFPIETRYTWIKKKWSDVAFRVNNAFTRKVGRSREGMDIIHTPNMLPVAKPRLEKLRVFLESLRETESDSKSPSK